MKYFKKTKKSMFLIVIVSLLLVVNTVSCTTEDDKSISTEDKQELTLTQAEKNMLIQMREEEKLARDVYDYLYEQFNVNIFDNISNSEQIHMEKVLELLNKYGIADPASSNLGEFNNEILQNLYNQLTEQGRVSVLEALKVGATIEDLDIYDLEEHIKETENQDILDVFNSLNCGSRNHLRAYYGQITSQDGDYIPQFISQEKFDEIVNTSHEMCN